MVLDRIKQYLANEYYDYGSTLMFNKKLDKEDIKEIKIRMEFIEYTLDCIEVEETLDWYWHNTDRISKTYSIPDVKVRLLDYLKYHDNKQPTYILMNENTYEQFNKETKSILFNPPEDSDELPTLYGLKIIISEMEDNHILFTTSFRKG